MMNQHYLNIVALAKEKDIQTFKDFCKLASSYQKEHKAPHTMTLYILSRNFMYYVATKGEITESLQSEHDRLATLNNTINKVDGKA